MTFRKRTHMKEPQTTADETDEKQRTREQTKRAVAKIRIKIYILKV